MDNKLTQPRINIGMQERVLSAVVGGLIVLLGFSRRDIPKLVLGLLAGNLLYRGLTGRSKVYNAMGVSSADREMSDQVSVPHDQGIRVHKSYVIKRSAHDLYAYWRRFENLPNVMAYLVSVTETDEIHSHWVAKGPVDSQIEWDAEIINDVPDNRIGWRSLDGSQVDNAGSVVFTPMPDGRGTRIEVTLKYNPPAGKLGAAVSTLLGSDPGAEIAQDLRRFKRLMETEIPSITKNQPARRKRTNSA
jgi:uncharacterized membrane protein